MRIAATLDTTSIPALLSRFLSIIDPDLWLKRYRSLHDQMRANPLLAPYFQESHALELRLGEVLDAARSTGRMAIGLAQPQDYALFSFIAPVVLVYDQLTDSGKTRVAGMLRDGLNSDLLAFRSEIETVTHLMHRGFEVSLQDIDGGYGFDVLATRDGVELEVECKSVSGDLGRQVHRRRMMELSWHAWPEIRRALALREGGHLIKVLLPASLHGNREFFTEITRSVGHVLQTGESVSAKGCDVESRRFDLAGTPFASTDPAAVNMESVQPVLEREIGHANQHVFFGYRPGRVAIAMAVESRKPDRVVHGLMRGLKTAAKSQLSGRRPGVLVVQFLELTGEHLLKVASHDSSDPRQAPALQVATNRFFENPDRSHIHSIIYRAGQGTLYESARRGKDRGLTAATRSRGRPTSSRTRIIRSPMTLDTLCFLPAEVEYLHLP